MVLFHFLPVEPDVQMSSIRLSKDITPSPAVRCGHIRQTQEAEALVQLRAVAGSLLPSSGLGFGAQPPALPGFSVLRPYPASLTPFSIRHGHPVADPSAHNGFPCCLHVLTYMRSPMPWCSRLARTSLKPAPPY